MPADVLVGRRLTVDALRSAFDAAMAGAGEGAPGYWPWIQVVRALARDGGATEASDGVLGDASTSATQAAGNQGLG